MELFKIGFVTIRLVDIIDISIVTFLFFKLYEWLRGSVAIRILAAILVVFLFWKVVDLLDMVLLKSILDQFLGVGAIALIIIFAPEIRRFLMIVVKNTFLDRLSRQLRWTAASQEYSMERLLNGVEDMKKARIGALIVLTGRNNLKEIQETGDQLNAEVSERMIYSIFQPQSPLHDGALIIDDNVIAAARCVLPISNNPNIPPELGLRHRAALGLTEVSDAMVVIVSEETAQISVAHEGTLERDLDAFTLENKIRAHYQG